MAGERKKRVSWYSVSEDVVKALFKGLLVVAVLVGSAYGYVRWERATLEKRAGEALEKARSLMQVVDDEGGAESHRATFEEGVAALHEADRARGVRAMRTALTRAQIAEGLFQSILDTLRDPALAGEARFIYVEGEIEFRRGETGSFRQAHARDVVYQGDYVRSANDGSAEILFGSTGTLFTVRPGTLLKVNRTVGAEGEPQAVGVQYGWVDLSTTEQPGGVETRYAQITLGDESDGTVEMKRSGDESRFAVALGNATLQSAETGEVVRLAALQQVTQNGGRFSVPERLPPPPKIVGPPDNFDVNLDRIKEMVLSWSDVPQARGGYRLQVSRNRLFSDRVIDVDGRESSSARLGIVGEGDFYWRVAASGADGVTGPWSGTQTFRVASLGGVFWEDSTPPELVVEDVYVNGHILIVTGHTEPGVRLEIGGRTIPVNADGSFSRSITQTRSGLVPIVVSATDAAGNRSEQRREVLLEEF